ncbi:SGNH/GDSL hydrolase family protein [Cohnella silvisoli]|uniref:SGNH/GDSL hydrolase family protein n=1 Tax=Cohnella silvisoli TaxID=2873699 RepID=A0ABV1KWU5_9BACL|nr:SGNH/GDSL hydrolase family protein [Cohnella silvisoli]MCD9023650.1 SGNH/GDSL hydrolase family protein [Cohnella silvisoli]
MVWSIESEIKKYLSCRPFHRPHYDGGAVVLAGWIDYIERLKKKADGYDLVFICYGQNDQGSLTTEEFGAIYENLIRRIKHDYPYAEIVTLVESSLQSETFPDVIKSLTKRYGLINVDTRQSFGKSALPYDQLTIDGVHPNNEGYKLYAQQIYDALSQEYDSGKQISELGDSLLYPQSSFTSGRTLREWTTINGFIHRGNALFGNKPGFTAESEFEGQFVALSYMTDPKGALVNVYVDGKFQRQISTNIPFVVNWKSIVTSGLAQGKHQLKVEIAPAKDAVSTGTFAHIIGYITN